MARDDSEMKKQGYHRLPATWQSPTASRPVDKETWRECHECGSLTPVKQDWRGQPDGTVTNAGTYTYVCPHCAHSHVGTPEWNEGSKSQERCHECGSELGDLYQCPKCSYPRGWMRVKCPTCSHTQPVHAPHWVVHCDVFHLECINCGSTFDSLCIC